VVGELVPKRLALHNPEDIARRVARPMLLVSKLAAPGVWVLSATTDALLKLFGSRALPDPGISEEELVAMLTQAAARGVIELTEQQIVERLFRLSDRTVAELMTPREKIAYFDLEHGSEPDIRVLQRAPHPRYLLCRGSLDDVLGFVAVHDLLLQYLRDGGVDVQRAVRDPHWVGLDYPALRLLHLFQSSGIHLALVQDDDDRLRGMVTLTDLLENVVGELPDVHEMGKPRIVQRDDGSWLVDASLQVAALRGALPLEHRARLDGLTEATVAHVVLKRAGGRPAPAAAFDVNGIRFEIVDMDGARVDKVLVQLPDGSSE
jgi:putative hemolysin